MPLHPQAEHLLEVMASNGDPPLQESTPAEVRAIRRSRLVPSTIDVHEIRDVDAGGVRARLYRPSAERGLGLFVYFHGGGWVIGDLDTHDGLARELAVESGQAVLSVDYRLAPEHPFPAGLDDAVTASRWAFENAAALGCDPSRIAIGGDSSGGNLAAVVVNTEPLPFRFQLLLYPVTDARANTQSWADFGEGYFLTAAGMHWFTDHYLTGGAGARDDPRVSPLLADDAALARAPETLVITAEFDILRDEGEAYAARLSAAGVPVTVRRYDGMIHAFAHYSDFLDDGHAALTVAGKALASALA